MSWHEDPIDAPQADVAEDAYEAEPVAAVAQPRRGNDVYYLGDTGRLPLDARRALCQLLIGPSIDQLRHAKLWPALIRSEAAIRSSTRTRSRLSSSPARWSAKAWTAPSPATSSTTSLPLVVASSAATSTTALATAAPALARDAALFLL